MSYDDSATTAGSGNTATAVPPIQAGGTGRTGKCYGCATSASQHCITLLRALATKPAYQAALCNQDLLNELIQHNLRRGNQQVSKIYVGGRAVVHT